MPEALVSETTNLNLLIYEMEENQIILFPALQSLTSAPVQPHWKVYFHRGKSIFPQSHLNLRRFSGVSLQ